VIIELSHFTVPEENRGEKMQNLRENCTENALKLPTISASCAQIELKNPLKIGKKLPKSCT